MKSRFWYPLQKGEYVYKIYIFEGNINGKLLIYIKNNIGPNTDPGTLEEGHIE